MQVATTAPQTPRGLFAVGPNMAEVLAVVAKRKACFQFVVPLLTVANRMMASTY
jgi:hypothetical protein